jgi:hypothetical protein
MTNRTNNNFGEIREILESLAQKSLDPMQWMKETEYKGLLQAIRSNPLLAELRGKKQGTVFGWHLLRAEQISYWIVNRSCSVGAAKALEEISHYFSNSVDKVEVSRVAMLSNFLSEDRFQFCNGVKIDGLVNLAERYGKDPSYFWRFPSDGMPIPQAVLELTAKIELKTVPEDEEVSLENIRSKTNALDEKINDTALCMSLFRPGTNISAYTYLTPASLPFAELGNGFSISNSKRGPLDAPVLRINLQQSDELLAKFSKIPDSLRNILRISMTRLNGFHSNVPWVDACIELRVCMESLFLSDNESGELRYRLGLRAGRMLGSNIEERALIKSVFLKAYNETSHAVHTGEGPSDKNNNVNKAAKYCKDAIISIINNKEIDWNKVELG